MICNSILEAFVFILGLQMKNLKVFQEKLGKLQFQKRFATLKMFLRLAHVRNRRRKVFWMERFGFALCLFLVRKMSIGKFKPKVPYSFNLFQTKISEIHFRFLLNIWVRVDCRPKASKLLTYMYIYHLRVRTDSLFFFILL